MAINKFVERKIEAEILGELYEKLENDLKNVTMKYDVVGKSTQQAKDWRTDELLWEDEEKTIPKYRDEYDYVPVPEDEITEEMRTREKIIKGLMVKLEKM